MDDSLVLDRADPAERAAWLRLALTPGLGARAARDLLAAFGLPGAIVDSSTSALAHVVGEQAARALAAEPPEFVTTAITATEAWLAADGRRSLLTLADADYPQSLLDSPDPPLVLFAVGRRELLTRPALAIVGARNCTQQGVANAEAFAEFLGHAGLTIVSGLAAGIDAAAHRGGLRTAASTIAVMGTGMDRLYPARNRALGEAIRDQGLLLSELPLGTPPVAANFPRRNRLIAGLSRGTLVVEAALHSGSLITAQLALEAGREVFAVPGSIHSPLAKGCHRLIKNGARLVEAASDVLDELRMPKGTTPVARSSGTPHASLMDTMGFDPIALDTLAACSGMTIETLNAALLDLEMTQDVERLPGNRYQRLR